MNFKFEACNSVHAEFRDLAPGAVEDETQPHFASGKKACFSWPQSVQGTTPFARPPWQARSQNEGRGLASDSDNARLS